VLGNANKSSKYPPAKPEAFTVAGPSKGPDRNRKVKNKNADCRMIHST